MTTWLTDTQALEYVGISPTEDNLRLLRVLGHKKKIRWTKFLGHVQYDQDSLDEYREQKARGKACVVNQDLKSSETKPEPLNPPTGTLSISTEEGVNASLRGISLARKTMKHKLPSHNSSSKGKGHNQNSQASL